MRSIFRALVGYHTRGGNHREYAADMYENGNKIGIMG